MKARAVAEADAAQPPEAVLLAPESARTVTGASAAATGPS